jgi:Domain of unknown function (DUF3520)/von Willebrand factor
MEPRIYPFWEPKPLQELDSGLRQAVEAVRADPMPGNAMEQALARAARVPIGTPVRRPWFPRRMASSAVVAAASLLFTLGVWAILSSIPVDEVSGGKGPKPVKIGLSPGFTDQEREIGDVSTIEYDIDGSLPPSRSDGNKPLPRHGSRQSSDPCSPSGDYLFQSVAANALSTFSPLVDADSYSDVRRFLLQEKQLPPRDAVRVAGLINSFSYKYVRPTAQEPVAFTLNLVECPWNRQNHLLRIGLMGRHNEEGAAPIARDVKLQVEFNTHRVAGYRLLGNNPMVNDPDEENLQGATLRSGHTITILYEIIPVGHPVPGGDIGGPKDRHTDGDEWLTVKLRYKEPDDDSSKILAQPLTGGVVKLARTPEDVRFAAAVAGFGMLLRKTEHCGNLTFAGVRDLAEKAVGQDVGGERTEFLKVIDVAETLARNRANRVRE